MSTLKFKCLVLDHDDTTVNSTPSIHYPAFAKILEELRPGRTCTQEEFLTANLTPGLFDYYTNVLGFTQKEMDREQEIWKEFIAGVVPPFFPGLPDLLRDFREAGGTLCVVSHSFSDFIRRDYDTAKVRQPDLIFGADLERSKCKPDPWPLEEIMRLTGYGKEDLLMVDDLDAGLEMAHRCGVRFAACGWGYENPAIRAYMEKRADYYLTSIADLRNLLFSAE